MPTTADDKGSYVLGTHDEELQRLGLQHRVWRPKMLEAWSAAGITEGSRVADFGCGPGYATIDLAEIVGQNGSVLGIERSPRFVSFAKAECQRRGFSNVDIIEADFSGDIPLAGDCDAVWCRWVASFVPNLQRLVQHVASALRPGGRAVFHEYVDYATWRMIPRSQAVENFVGTVMESWRVAGGEPDIAFSLLPALRSSGFEIVDETPIVFAVHPSDFAWRWPSAFLKSNLSRLLETGRITPDLAAQVSKDFNALERSPESLMLTPMVLQIIARRR
jgi:SAM-dependent methyltransferase